MLETDINGTKYQVGAHREGETPVPMPNTEVKPSIGYNTWVIKPWENSTVPNYTINHPNRVVFVYILFLSK